MILLNGDKGQGEQNNKQHENHHLPDTLHATLRIVSLCLPFPLSVFYKDKKNKWYDENGKSRINYHLEAIKNTSYGIMKQGGMVVMWLAEVRLPSQSLSV